MQKSITHMLESVDKNIKTAIVNIFYMFKKVEENMNIIRKIGDVRET